MCILFNLVVHHLPGFRAFFSLFLYLIKEESSASGSCESGGDKLRPIGQDGVAVGTREEACSTNVVQEDTSHRLKSGND